MKSARKALAIVIALMLVIGTMSVTVSAVDLDTTDLDAALALENTLPYDLNSYILRYTYDYKTLRNEGLSVKEGIAYGYCELSQAEIDSLAVDITNAFDAAQFIVKAANYYLNAYVVADTEEGTTATAITDPKTVAPGSIIRVDIGLENNFWAANSQTVIVYDSNYFNPVKLDGTVFTYGASTVTYDEFFRRVSDYDNLGVDLNGDTPSYTYQDTMASLTGHVSNLNAAQNLKVFPHAWKAAPNNEGAAKLPAYANYNALRMDTVMDSNNSNAWGSIDTIGRQTIGAFYLQVKSAADIEALTNGDGVGDILIPASALRSSTYYQNHMFIADSRDMAYTSGNVAYGDNMNFNFANASVNAYEFSVAPDPCDYTDLDAALLLTPEYGATEYTYATWTAFNNAKAAAQGIARGLLNEGTNQADIDYAALVLQNAYDALAFRPANFAGLEAALAAATASDSSLYTAASWATFAAAKTAASTYNRSGKNILNQTEINALATALTNATAGLVALGNCDYTALDAAIALAPALPESGYTVESWTAYASAKAAAQAVARDMIDDEAGTNQGIIDAAETLLTQKYAALAPAQAATPELLAVEGSGFVVDTDRMFVYGWDPNNGEIDDAGTDFVSYEVATVTNGGYLVITASEGGFGTGTTVELYDADDNLVETYIYVIFGDIDGDGYITDFDAAMANDYYNAMFFDLDFDSAESPYLFAADLDQDDCVSDFDAAIINDCYNAAIVIDQTDPYNF